MRKILSMSFCFNTFHAKIHALISTVYSIANIMYMCYFRLHTKVLAFKNMHRMISQVRLHSVSRAEYLRTSGVGLFDSNSK